MSAAKERWFLGLLLLVAFGLRAWDLGSAGLDHYDEGAYVFSALGWSDASQPHRLFPGQDRFAPPGYFGLVTLAYWIAGAPSDTAALMVNVLFGTFSVGLLYWLVRGAFGPAQAAVAATLLALDEYHIGLCRAALTDVVFAAAFMLALGLSCRAIERRSYGGAVLAGLAVGFAWNTKYHGWLVVPVCAAALLCHALFRSERDRRWLGALPIGVVIGAVAALCYLPWVLHVQGEPGGYEGLARYQRGFLNKHWIDNLVEQFRQQAFLDGPLSRAALPLACALDWRPSGRGVPFWLALVVLVGLQRSGTFGCTVLLACAGVALVLRSNAPYRHWLVLGAFGTFGLLTPLYHPYGRLALPFVLACKALAAVAVVAAAERARGKTGVLVAPLWPPMWAIFAGVVFSGASRLPDPSNPWRPSDSMRRATEQMLPLVPPGSRVIVIGDPTVSFYFQLAGRRGFERVEDMKQLDAITEPAFLVRGRYSDRARSLRDGLAARADRLQALGTYPVDPKDIRLLDDYKAEPARVYRAGAGADRAFDLRLFRLQPAPGTAAGGTL